MFSFSVGDTIIVACIVVAGGLTTGFFTKQANVKAVALADRVLTKATILAADIRRKERIEDNNREIEKEKRADKRAKDLLDETKKATEIISVSANTIEKIHKLTNSQMTLQMKSEVDGMNRELLMMEKLRVDPTAIEDMKVKIATQQESILERDKQQAIEDERNGN